MLALHPRVVDIIWQAIEPRLPEVIDEHPLGCHRPRRDERECFEAILFRLVTGCSWDVAGRLGKGSETTLRRRRDEWWQAGVSTVSSTKRWPATTGSSGSICPKCRSTDRSTRRPSVVKGPDPTPLIAANQVGSGLSPPTATGSRSVGRSPARTATTVCCSSRPSMRSTPEACWLTSTRCILTRLRQRRRAGPVHRGRSR